MIKVDYIGGVEETYMVEKLIGDGIQHGELFLTLEEVQDMITQFKRLLKPIHFQEAVYGRIYDDVEEYYKDD